jgi:histidine phosphotransferase ChpT
LAPKNAVKLLLNLCLVAAAAAPRGGVVSVDLTGEGNALSIKVSAEGSNVRFSHAVANLLAVGEPETIDGHSIQPYYTKLLAKECGLTIEATTTPDCITLNARRPANETGTPAANATAEADPLDGR